jgi:hypothetical protein
MDLVVEEKPTWVQTSDIWVNLALWSYVGVLIRYYTTKIAVRLAGAPIDCEQPCVMLSGGGGLRHPTLQEYEGREQNTWL